ncbi:wee1-like protein kinase [Planococcus citri]|uniref:wee1-like protein kinase n=1 Tax=Planococcus citri TaxID=170843 RepID=UPI0031F9E27D
MEIDSPFPKFVKGKRLNISPIPKRLFLDEAEAEDETSDAFQERLAAVQRRLSFDYENSMILDENMGNAISDENNVNMCDISKSADSESPPFKKAKSLKVFDSSTPFTGRTTPPSKDTSLTATTATPRANPRLLRFKTSPANTSHLLSRSLNAAPVNPFTPSGRVLISENQKRRQKHRKAFQEWLSGSYCEDSIQNTSKNGSDDVSDKSINGISLSDLETSRFAEEFKVESFIASGTFGDVYKCVNYLDGMEYAIKRSAIQVAGTNAEHLARKEVFAHAALKSHLHIVSYYSSWIENGHLYIQTEYCNGGSLESAINEQKKEFTECGLRRLTNHIAKGLKHIHSLHLAHMDIKPSNIFIHKIDTLLSSDEELDDVDRDDIDLVYKIGDLGHVIVVDEPYDVIDGDCRYMPKELLNEDYSSLQKADVFSFGMTLYEAAGGGPLPKNGDEWQRLRSGDIAYLNKYSSTFNQIIRSMLHPDPDQRPNIKSILQRTRVISESLQQQIFSWKVKTDFYAQHVKLSSLMDSNHSPVICADNIPKIFVEKV